MCYSYKAHYDGIVTLMLALIVFGKGRDVRSEGSVVADY